MGPFFTKLNVFFDTYLREKAPSLPGTLKSFCVKIVPWVVIVFVIILIPDVISRLGFRPLSKSNWFVIDTLYGQNILHFISGIFLAISWVLNILSVPSLFSKTFQSWNLIFYSIIFSCISGLLNYSIDNINIILLIHTLFLYIWFQIKEYYK